MTDDDEKTEPEVTRYRVEFKMAVVKAMVYVCECGHGAKCLDEDVIVHVAKGGSAGTICKGCQQRMMLEPPEQDSNPSRVITRSTGPNRAQRRVPTVVDKRAQDAAASLIAMRNKRMIDRKTNGGV